MCYPTFGAALRSGPLSWQGSRDFKSERSRPLPMYTHPECMGGMNCTFRVEIEVKHKLRFIFTPKKAKIAELLPYLGEEKPQFMRRLNLNPECAIHASPLHSG